MRRSIFAFLALLGLFLFTSLACGFGDFLGEGLPEDPYTCADAGGEWRNGLCYFPEDEGDGNADPAARDEELGENRQAPADKAGPDDAQAEEQANAPVADPAAEDGSLAGTYVGTSDYPDKLYVAWESEPGEADQFPVTGHNVSITIAPDGAASGTFLLQFSGVYDPDHEDFWGTPCPGYMDLSINGTFSGRISNESQTLQLTENWTCDMNFSCDMLKVCPDEPVVWEFEVQVGNGTLTARALPLPSDESGEVVWTITATRQ